MDLNPGWKLVKWTDESSRALIAREYPWFLPTYDAYPSYIQRSDAARYFIVYHHGGVYADLDIECSKPFAPVLASHRAVFSYKVGTNMSRGLVNALFASEARHPLWHTVFDLLGNDRPSSSHFPWCHVACPPHHTSLGHVSGNRSSLGATAATHVDVVRSTGPGLLREALLHLRGAASGGASSGGAAGGLSKYGVELLDSAVWHPILAEQKRGRDPAAAAAIANSHCYHHFVSSWMTHDKSKHGETESQRAGGHGGGNAVNGGPGGVPTGQSLRVSNPWKSYEVATEAVDAKSLGARGAAAGASTTTQPTLGVVKSEKEVIKTMLSKAVLKRKARRRKAGGG